MKINRQKPNRSEVTCGSIPIGEIFEYLGGIYMAIDSDDRDVTVSDKEGGLCAVNLETGYVVSFNRWDIVSKQLEEYDDYEFTVYTDVDYRG